MLKFCLVPIDLKIGDTIVARVDDEVAPALAAVLPVIAGAAGQKCR